MNIDTLTTTIENQRAAWKASREAADQVRENQDEIQRAQAKCADLRANDDGDVSKLAKALTEQAGIIEIATARGARLQEAASAAKKEAERLSTVTVGVLCDARTALMDYRHSLRVTELVRDFRVWVSLDAIRSRAGWLKCTISELAWEDQRFDEVAALPGYRPNDETAKWEANFEATATYLEANAEDLPSAFEYVAQREAYLASFRAKNQMPPNHKWELIDLEAA